MTILVVSPHLDDAALSVGGAVIRATAAGTRVVIASVYTAGPPLRDVAPRMRRFADYATRIAEDDAASSVLGAEVRRLGQIERAFRRPFLRGWSFFTTPADRGGFTALDAVRPAIARVLDEVAPSEVWVPIGVGNHVDHVETLIAATDAADARGWLDRLRFYEDFYALAGSLRLRHFVTRHRAWPRWRSPLIRARRLAMILKAIGAARRGPAVETFLVPALAGARWVVSQVDIRNQLERKLEAIACYGSQTRAFGGLGGITRALRAYHAWWGGAEPMWRAVG